MIFLLQQLTSMNFFRPMHEYFLGLLVIHYSFTFNLSFAWTIFVLRSPPHKFSAMILTIYNSTLR